MSNDQDPVESKPCEAGPSAATVLLELNGPGSFSSLTDPFTGLPFTVDLRFFATCFDVFDREEDLGEELNCLDPNNDQQLKQLFIKRLFSSKYTHKYMPHHKYDVARVLEQALLNPSTDFKSVLSWQNLVDIDVSLPTAWMIRDARHYFWVAYCALIDTWKLEITNAGFELVDPGLLSIQM